jgi:hypothetical protein
MAGCSFRPDSAITSHEPVMRMRWLIIAVMC